MKVWIDAEEEYPIFSYSTDPNHWLAKHAVWAPVLVDDLTLVRWRKAFQDFSQVQQELRELTPFDDD